MTLTWPYPEARALNPEACSAGAASRAPAYNPRVPLVPPQPLAKAEVPMTPGLPRITRRDPAYAYGSPVSAGNIGGGTRRFDADW